MPHAHSVQPNIETTLRAAGYYARENGVSHAELTSTAYEILTSDLERYGNRLSEEHRTALYALVGLFTKMAQRRLKGRYAFGLPTGMGKTSAIIAWCTALHRLGLDHVSVAVSAAKVEALCQLKRDLIAHGVPEDSIGLIHSYGSRASLPSTSDNENRPIILVTHNRLRGVRVNAD